MKITKEQIEKIKEETELGKTAKEIAELLDITVGMVEYQRKKNSWKSQYNPSKLYPYLKEIKKYVEKEYTDDEISKLYNCDKVTVYNFRKKYGLERRNLISNPDIEIPKEVIEVLLGTVMGDSSLQFRGISSRLITEHSIKQSDYVNHLAEVFKCLEPKVTLTKQNSRYPAISLRTKSFPSLTKFYNSFYKNGIKVIPFELFENFTAKSLAYLIMDDGFPIRNRKKEVSSIGIALCNFKTNELKKFIEVLKDKFNLNFYIVSHNNKHYNKNYSDIIMNGGQLNVLKQLIRPYMLDWALYKIEGSLLRESEKVQSPLDNSNPS